SAQPRRALKWQRVQRVARETNIQTRLSEIAGHGDLGDAGQVAAQNQKLGGYPAAHTANLHLPPGTIRITAQHGPRRTAVETADHLVAWAVAGAQEQVIRVDQRITGLCLGQTKGIDRTRRNRIEGQRLAGDAIGSLKHKCLTTQAADRLAAEGGHKVDNPKTG